MVETSQGSLFRRNGRVTAASKPLRRLLLVAPPQGWGRGGGSPTSTIPANDPTTAAEEVTQTENKDDAAAANGDRKSLPHDLEEVCRGRFERSGGGDGGVGAASQLPRRFAYSLGKPFHSQRVASVRFVILGAPTPELESERSGFPPDLRLVTGEQGCRLSLSPSWICSSLENA